LPWFCRISGAYVALPGESSAISLTGERGLRPPDLC
jgi:hypothetical protein